MLSVGRRKTETWVHSFSVGSETRRHKGYTIYRITSIVFPRSRPEALTRVTLWKRFSEVKKLHKELVRRHRERHLPGTVPGLTEQSYFKRFDPAVIEERKRYIQQLLEFAGQEPILHRSHAFLTFFARGIFPEDDQDGDDGSDSLDGGGSPAKDHSDPGNGCGNGETIKKEPLDVRGNGTMDDAGTVDSSTSGGEDVVDGSDAGSNQIPPAGGSLIDSMISETGSSWSESGDPVASDEPPVDYLVGAAMVFSKAVEAEANGEYQRAFDQYKAGIERLLDGAKDDTNVTRRKIAKEKSCKYVAKAEEIYGRHLEQTAGTVDHSIPYDPPSSPVQLLERPLNFLSRYKVVKVIGTVMQVQDVTDKKFYIMKSIRRPPPAESAFSSAAVFPQDVPYMVPLVAYFRSTDGGIFLLLRLMCAGRLWDFIRAYRKPDSYCPSPEDRSAVDESEEANGAIPEVGNEVAPQGEPNQGVGYDSGFLELVNEYSNGQVPEVPPDESEDEVAIEARPDEEQEPEQGQEQEQEVIIPSFDALSKDMDVRELLSCSQQLLKAVTQTLEESNEHAAAALSASSTETSTTSDRPQDAKEEEPKSHSSQLGLAGIASISEARDEQTPDLLPEGSVRRWISELVIAVDSLHFNGIVCGDLTMDNLLLGPEGQLMLTYFHRRGESYFCQPGGAHPVAPKQTAIREMYVAPERPLEPRSDFWSVGVIMFELLTKRKFVSCHPSGVFCYHEVQYPEGMELSLEARELLEGLLQPDVERRLDFKGIIASPFFRTVDWSDVKRRGMTLGGP